MAFDWIQFAGNFLLFALVFGMSATVDIDCMKKQIRNVRALATGVVCQFVVLPFLGFLVVRTFALTPTIGIPLLVVTSSPGGSYSNWWCSMFNADLALSVTMTAISTILSMATLPFNLLLYTRFSYHRDVVQNLDWNSLFLALGIVMGAICIGLICSAKFTSLEFKTRANQLGNFAGLALIIFSATMTNTGGGDTAIWERDLDFYLGVMLPCFAGLVVSNIVAAAVQLRYPERVTVAIECCYQNVGIATSLALTMFGGQELSEAMGVPFFYGAVEALLVGTYCMIAWKMGWTKAPRNAPFWKILWTSYEVVEMAEADLEGIEVDVSESDDTVDQMDGGIMTHYYHVAWATLDPTYQPPARTTGNKAPSAGRLV